ncbi:MAG: prenyltransferase [Candidatus Eremiobacteraeota bacterium]|nr:prenyltransferase [Candidatus Eremiobacteraeota bacterium]
MRLSRLKFLAGGVLGVALGTAAAAFFGARPIAWLAWLTAQACVTSFQLMTHYSNDYFDRHGDRDARRTPFSGGSGALAERGLAPSAALIAALACAGAGSVFAALLAAAFGRPLAAGFAIAVAILAWSYSAPPLRLCARGLGELDAALVVAVFVPLLGAAAQTGSFDPRIAAATFPGACAMFVMMLCVELPDAAGDAVAGKRHLIVRRGAPAAVPLIRRTIIATFAAAALGVGFGLPQGFGLLLGLAIPLGLGLARALPAAAAKRMKPGVAEGLAARGVAFFFVVALDGWLGCLAALPWRI